MTLRATGRATSQSTIKPLHQLNQRPWFEVSISSKPDSAVIQESKSCFRNSSDRCYLCAWLR